MGSDGGRALQSRVLEGLCLASLIREAVVGQRPLFIELSLLKGVCAFFFFFLWVGSREIRGHDGECKGAVCAENAYGSQEGYPDRPTREDTGLRINRKRADV